jgi:uncharacterized BrkB/YihY/UPF0761 family membrane protein
MDSQKAQLESTIRARRARLGRRLGRLETRIEQVKATSKQVGIVTGAVIATIALITMVGAIVMAVRRSHRPRPLFFAR